MQASATQPAPSTAHQELLLRFNRSQSYRAFVFDALKHPEWGGHQWAHTVLALCRRYPLDATTTAANSANPTTPPPTEAQAAARLALTTRCDMRKDENSELSSRMFMNAGDLIISTVRALVFSQPKGDIDPQALEARFAGPDPHQNLLAAMLKTGITNEEKTAAVAQVLRTGSPYLIQMAIPSESGQSARVNTVKTYFDGTWYTSQGNANALHLAYDLATCNMGLDCGANSFKALSLCASRGFCGDNVASAIRNGVAQREGLRWETIEGLAQHLTNAIQLGNAQAFIPPQPAKKP